MRFPLISDVSQAKDITTVFQGYNHTPSCKEGFFYDMKNISTKDYPVLSNRLNRGISRTFTNPLGFCDKDDLVWVDVVNNVPTLYINNTAVTLSGVSLANSQKNIVKMGAFIVIFPDKVWYNTKDHSCGYIDASNVLSSAQTTFTLVGTNGANITWHDDEYYKTHAPQNGNYKMTTTDGKTSLSVYSSATGLWSSVPTTYMKISASNIGRGLKVGDGVKISVNLAGISWDYAKNIFINVDETNDNIRYSTFTVYDVANGYITVPALLNENKTFTLPITAERKAPDMAYVCECQNRLWGCSTDGHELYASKLGDVTNWTTFAGISTDSWSATVGSDGIFTGCINYLGYPIFFKEESMIKITVSGYGAHSYRETVCRGVQEGSSNSLVQLNEVLYYKASNAVCVYDGSFPSEVSDALGVGRYTNAVGGSIDNRYYLNMLDESNHPVLFVYNAKYGLWTKEDSVRIKFFARHDDDLYLIANDNKLYSVMGTNLFGSTTKESDMDWMVESGNIGFQTADKKYVSRVNLRMSLDLTSYVSFLIQYDSNGQWINVFNMAGKGTQTFTIPVIPRRCDHFKYMLRGHGNVKLYSLTKTYEEGSDI